MAEGVWSLRNKDLRAKEGEQANTEAESRAL